MKLLFIGAINQKHSPKGGEEYKNQLFIEKLESSSQLEPIIFDTYQWKKKPFLIVNLFYYLFFKNVDSIVISASSASTYLLLKILNKVKPSILCKIHYFVIGGYFPVGIKTRRYNWKVYQRLKSVVVEGQVLRKQLLESSDLKNLFVVPNFKKFDFTFKPNIKNVSKFKFVYLGRISRAKGIVEIIEAVEILKKNEHDFEVDFFGPVEDEINFPQDLPLNYKGYLNIMNEPSVSYNILSEYSCMLFPTYWQGEGFPGVVIDAYIAGLPVIATDWNINKEVIEDEITGLIIPVQDSKVLALAMLKLLKNPNLVSNMRQYSTSRAKDFHIDIIWPKLFNLLLND
jgi:glycosyltransferase involved in cell wall biosynthesis